jgi:hypothetical protein
VDEGAKQLGAVDASGLSSGDIEIEHVRKKLAPDFVPTFKSLSSVMVAQETKLQIKEARQACQISQPVSSQLQTDTTLPPTAPSAELPVEPSTPDQPSHPVDPKWSGSSTASQDEEATKKLLFNLLSDTMTMLESDFRKIIWQRSGLNVELAQTYYKTHSPTDF